MKETIEKAWSNRELLKESATKEAVLAAIEMLDRGEIRVAETSENGIWVVNEWVKEAILMYFAISEMRTMKAGEMEYYDKIPLKHNLAERGIRAVPPATARYGSYIAPGAVLMPSYVNIGAYVDSGTMVDTWATVGSCAQIGKNVHLSGGVNH